MLLSQLDNHQLATIVSFHDSKPDLVIRLREIGFSEGDDVEILHTGLFGRNPMTVRVNGTLIAMRKYEASLVEVEVASS